MKIGTHKGSGRYVVRIPASLSPSGKRYSKYSKSKRELENFIADLRRQQQEYGRAQVFSPAERALLVIVRQKYGGLGAMLDMFEHYRRTGAMVEPIAANRAAEEFTNRQQGSSALSPHTKADIRFRLHSFAEHFGEKPMHQITAAEIDRWLQTKTEGSDRRSYWKRLSPLFKFAVLQRWVLKNPLDDFSKEQRPAWGESSREVYTPRAVRQVTRRIG